MTSQTQRRLHSGCLSALAISLCVGEGLIFVGMAAVASCLWWRRHQVRAPILLQGLLRPWLGAMGAYLACGLWANLQSPYGVLRAAEWGRQAPLLLCILVPLSATCLPRRSMHQAAWCFAMALGGAAVLGIGQYIWDVRPLEFLSRAEFGMASQSLVPGGPRSVAGGFYFHRLKLAHVLVIGVLGALTYALRGARPQVGLLGLLVGCAALVLTFARGAWLALAVGAALMALRRPSRRHLTGLVAAAAALVLLVLLAPAFRGRLLSAFDADSSGTRALIWDQAAQIITDHPQGVGLGNYPSVVRAYYDALPPHDAPRTYAHSLFLSAWAEAGAPGLLAFVAAHAAVLGGLWRRARPQSVAGDVAWWSLGCMAAYLCLGLTHDVLYHPVVAGALWAALAWAMAMLAPAHLLEP